MGACDSRWFSVMMRPAVLHATVQAGQNMPGGVSLWPRFSLIAGEREYRLKSADEEHERVARESELEAA